MIVQELAAAYLVAADTVYVRDSSAADADWVYLYRIVIGVLFAMVTFFLRDIAHELKRHGAAIGSNTQRIALLEAENDWEERARRGFGRRRTDPHPAPELLEGDTGGDGGGRP
jgi:hypothetical protein